MSSQSSTAQHLTHRRSLLYSKDRGLPSFCRPLCIPSSGYQMGVKLTHNLWVIIAARNGEKSAIQLRSENYNLGAFIKHVDMAWGGGVNQIFILLHKPY